MEILDKIIKKISIRNSKSYIKYLRKRGCTIGEYTHFHDPKSLYIDPKRLKYISMGKYVQITRNVTILAHDFSYSVLKKCYNDLPQKIGHTVIGNNVFIGMNSIILMGSKIGNNVIIGAGSVVSGTIPDNVVIAGNPAKIICTLDEYHNKCNLKMKKNLYDTCLYYKEKNNCYPTIDELGFLSLLFADEKFKKDNINIYLYPSIEKEELRKFVLNYQRKYESIEDFMNKYFNEKGE